MLPNGATGVVAVLILMLLAVAPVHATSAEDGWVVVDGDHVMWGDDTDDSRALAMASAHGYVRLTDAGLETPLTIRLVDSVDIEHFRSELEYGAARASAITGVSVRVDDGVVNRADHGPGMTTNRGEITVVVSDESPCTGNWAGCAGVRYISPSDVSPMSHQEGGVIWFRQGYTPTGDTLRHLVLHELGHALGLAHYDEEFEGNLQVMHSSSYDATEYQTGDTAGLREAGEDGRADFVSWSASRNGFFDSVGGTYDPLTGDFDGDGRTDLLWYGEGSRADVMWWGGSRGGFPVADTSVEVHGSYDPVAGDFDGDGFDDIYWYGPGSDYDTIWWGRNRSNWPRGGSVDQVSGVYRLASGDLDGDGDDELLFYKPGSGISVMYWGASRTSWPEREYFDIGGDYEPVVGDFDADGSDDIFFYAEGSTQDQMYWGTDWTIGCSLPIPVQCSRNPYPDGGVSTRFQVSGRYSPAAGDFDGDGHAEVLWHGLGIRPDYRWQVSDRTSKTTDAIQIGGSHQLLVGDFDGDGSDDLVGYVPGR